MAKLTVPRSVLVFPAVFNALVFSSSALAAGTWYDARNDAMGGTGVASSTYGSAVLANPALMTKAKPDDDVSIIIPSAGAQITDKDKMVDKIDNITDTVNRYQDLFENASGFELLRRIPEIQAASGDLANTLWDLRGNKANATAGVAIAVTIPNETLPFAFVTKAYGTAHVRANVKEGDIVILQGVADGSFAGIPGGPFGLANIQNLLGSSANGLAALNTDYGIAVAHEFTIAGQPVSIGITPKLQKTWLYNYSASVYNYDKNDLRDGRYRSTESGFNIDAGMATVFAENWTLGVTGQNLVSRDLETKEVNGYRDTYEIRPLVTAGLAWDKGPVTLTGDVDLTETHRFKSQENSQYAGVGAEYRVLDWLQLRAGYRADMRSTDENVATAGFGLSPFNNSVHLDLAGSVGQNNTWGAMAQLGFNF